MPPIVIAILATLVLFVLLQAGFQFFGRRTAVKQRLEGIQRTGGGISFDDDGMALDNRYKNMEGGVELTLEPTFSPLAETLHAVLSGVGINVDRHRKDHAMDYYRAGFVSPNHPIYFLGFRILAGPLLALAGIYYLGFAESFNGTDSAINIILGIVMLGVGLVGPQILLKNSRLKREKKLTNQFPDSLDLLLVCVETGLALDGALARVTRELGRTAPEITEELNRTRMELSLLNDRQQALLNLGSRTNLAPFKTLVGALLQAERMGTSLTDTLRVLSDDYRMRRLMDAETRAGRLPAIITIPLVLFMLPALFMIILGPAAISIMEIKGK